MTILETAKAEALLQKHVSGILTPGELEIFNANRREGGHQEAEISDWNYEDGYLEKTFYVKDGEAAVLRTAQYGNWESLGLGLLIEDECGELLSEHKA